VAFHVGGRGKKDAQELFEKVPTVFMENAVFFTDFWNGYHILDEGSHIEWEGRKKAIQTTLSGSTILLGRDVAD
jgi:hypothetical protein